MEQYIKKSALIAEIEKLVDKGKYHEEYDCAYRDGNNGALYALKNKLNSIEVKEVDLEHLEQEVKDFCYKFDDRKDKWYDMTPHDKNIMISPTWSNFTMQLAKHFFELGLKAQKDNIRHSMDETPKYPCDILLITKVDNVFLYRYMENGRPVDRETPYFHNILNGKCWCYCSDVVNE